MNKMEWEVTMEVIPKPSEEEMCMGCDIMLADNDVTFKCFKAGTLVTTKKFRLCDPCSFNEQILKGLMIPS